jgi:hypothetical protein
MVPLPEKLQATIRSRLGPLQIADGSPTGWQTEPEPSESEKTPSRARCRKTGVSRMTQSPPPGADIVRALRRFRYDPAFRGERRVPIKTLAGLVGLSHETLYAAMRRGNASEQARAKLTWALKAIAEGRLWFRRRGQVWEPHYDIRCRVPGA